MADTEAGAVGARRLVELLDGAKHRFDPAAREEKERALRMLADRRILDPALLIRLHEALCFVQAYPDGPAVLDLAEQALRGFEARVRLAVAGRAALIRSAGARSRRRRPPRSAPAVPAAAGPGPSARPPVRRGSSPPPAAPRDRVAQRHRQTRRRRFPGRSGSTGRTMTTNWICK